MAGTRVLAAAGDAVDERLDRSVERGIAVERPEGWDQRERRRAGERVERPELSLVLVADRAEQPFGFRQGIAEDESVEREPEPRGLGIGETSIPQRPIDHLARGMVGWPGRMEAEMEVEQARMAVGEVAIGGGHVAEIEAPVCGRDRQLDRGQGPVGDPPHQLVL